MKAILATALAGFILFGGTFSASAAINQSDLNTYLNQIQLTEQQLEEYLASFDLTVEDYESIEELEEELGPRATSETINQLIEDYGMTIEELENLLKEYGELENGKTIEETFLFVYDIEAIILLDSEIGSGDLDEDWTAEIEALLSEFGITEQEINNLIEHLDQIAEKNPSVLDELERLSLEMETIGDFETITELTPAQISKLLSVTDQMKTILELDFSFYLVKDGKKTPVSFEALLQMTDTKGASLLIEMYNKNGDLLLDMILTGDMIGSDLIDDANKVITDTKEQVTDKKPTTEKGAKMPNTAGNYAGTLLGGLLFLGASIFTFRKIGALK